MNEYRQTQDSMAIVGAIAGGVFLLIIVALMVVGSFGFSAALFLAGGVAAIVAVVLVVGFHEKPVHPKAAKSKPAATAPKAPIAPTSAPTPEATHTPQAAAAPQRLDAARDGQADDLKQIKGVGPQLERLLNDMGFFHFDQIAQWTDAELAWVDENLEGFKGRASRDEWVAQAKALAKS